VSKKWFLWRVVGTLIALGLMFSLLTVGGVAIYRTGWSQGYIASQLEAGDEEGEGLPETLPYIPYGFRYPGWYLGFPTFLYGAGLIFKIGLLFLLLLVIGQIIRFLIWGKMMGGGPRGRYWTRHWRRHHGCVPPWHRAWEDMPSDRDATRKATTDPDVETDAVEA
jgi:hypothetical protein